MVGMFTQEFLEKWWEFIKQEEESVNEGAFLYSYDTYSPTFTPIPSGEISVTFSFCKESFSSQGDV